MRAIGYMAAYTVAANVLATLVAASMGWDFWHVLACIYAGVVGWLTCEAYA